MIKQYTIQLPAYERGFHLITDQVKRAIPDQLPEQGLINIFLRHTSAGLCINENHDPAVLEDFETTYNHMVPENQPFYTHTEEGSDDMPSHIKSSMTGVSLTFPIRNGAFDFGTWQGIYLCEFRNHSSGRKLTITVYE